MTEVPSIDSQNRNNSPNRDGGEPGIEPHPECSDESNNNSPATVFKELPHNWAKLLSDFLKKMNLIQTQKTFDIELLVVPFEIYNSPEAHISELLKGFQNFVSSPASKITESKREEKSLFKRKKSNLNNSAFPKTRIELDQEIDEFISQKKAKIITSNQKEFIEKASRGMSCARVNTKKINPNLHNKMSVAHNREGPLIRSLGSSRNETKNVHHLAGTWSHKSLNTHVSEQLDIAQRLKNIEDHLNLVYADIDKKKWKPIDRISAVEAKIMQLERLLPSWASQHFNQPNRKHPTPPPPTYPFKDSRGRMFLNSEPRPND